MIYLQFRNICCSDSFGNIWEGECIGETFPCKRCEISSMPHPPSRSCCFRRNQFQNETDNLLPLPFYYEICALFCFCCETPHFVLSVESLFSWGSVVLPCIPSALGTIVLCFILNYLTFSLGRKWLGWDRKGEHVMKRGSQTKFVPSPSTWTLAVYVYFNHHSVTEYLQF